MINTAIITSVKSLLIEYKTLLNCKQADKEDLRGLRYLLGQTIRHYKIVPSNRHISCGAINRWNELCKDSIKCYKHNDKVTCNNLITPKCYSLYTGAKGAGLLTTLSPSSTFIFKQMFQEDHVIPIKLILEELIKLKTVNSKSIENILNKMHICLILKEEDRRIGRTKGRSLKFNHTIINVYNKNCIFLYP